MSVRHEIRRSPATGATRERWIVDVDFEHADGRRERVRKVSPVQTRRGAEEYERQLRAAMLDPRRNRPRAPTFGKFVRERWWPTYPDAAGNRARTKREKEGHLRLYLLPALDAVALDEVSGEVVERLFASLAERGIGPKTRNNVRATLRRVLASAAEWGVIDAVPELPHARVAAYAADFLVREESDRLLAAARDAEEWALLVFALHTGARAGEQLAIEWRDVDVDRGLLFIRRASSMGITGATKGGHDRVVPITAQLSVALAGITHSRGPLVFCHGDGTALAIGQLHERLWGACRRSGLRRIRWHDLRHSFASQLVLAGVPLLQVQAWLGHATIAMTMRYAHLAPREGHELIRVLDTPCGAPTAPNGGLWRNPR